MAMASSDVHMSAAEPPDFADYMSMLRPYIAQRAPREQVEDLLQETLLRLHQRSDGDAIENYRAYAFQTARSVIIDGQRRDHVRRRTSHSSLLETHHPVDPITPEHKMLGKESIDRLVAALQEMPERTRDVFVLHRFEDMSYPAIAEHLGLSLSAVGKHIMKALRFLAQRDFP